MPIQAPKMEILKMMSEAHRSTVHRTSEPRRSNGLRRRFSVHTDNKVPQNGDFGSILGDFGPLNVIIIHHRDPQKPHPCVNPRLLSYQL